MPRRLLAPSSTTVTLSFVLLVMRLWFGAAMVLLHGWPKLAGYAALSPRFSDPYGLGSPLSLALSIVAEVLAASLIVAGLATRAAAVVLGINMITAFVFAHGMRLSGPGNGELAYLYLGVWTALFVAGAGRYSLDAALFGRR
jgi:putative oxidoreductase